MADEKAGVNSGKGPLAERRSAGDEIALAIDLGWRVAALHALSPRTLHAPSEVTEGMLLNRRSLLPADRLELEVQTIAGVAKRSGIPLDHTQVARLVALAQDAAESDTDERAFRAELERRHTAFDKQLWTASEQRGKAYELGNFMSDTWNRVERPRVTPDPRSELVEVFSPVRVERMKLLLDDLQARVDPLAAHVINSHLDQWSARVRTTPVPAGRSLEPVERQTIIWRQMLTGDKEPEAFISSERRAEVRDELGRHLWKRYRRWWWVVPILVILGGALGLYYSRNEETVQQLIGGALAVLGALGITRASLAAAARRSLNQILESGGWGDLMWNRALAAVICRETSLVGEVFGGPGGPAGQRTNSTSTVSPAASDSRSSGTNA